MTAGRTGEARSLADVLAGTCSKTRRTNQPVRRDSYNVGEREKRIWSPIKKREIGPRISAAEAFNRSHRSPGERGGPLGHFGVAVLRELYRIVDFRTGRCEPSIDYIARRMQLSRGLVVRALKKLKAHGFLNWIRRTEPIDNPGPGPQVRQVSNAYWFDVPAKVRALVAKMLGNAPIPDDEAQRRAVDAANTAAMVESLPLRARMRMLVDDPHLAESLAAMGEHFEGSSANSANVLNTSEKDQRG